MLSPSTILTARDAFVVRQIGDETIFLSEDGEQIHMLDEVGTFIWNSIDGNRSVKDILDRLCAEFEVSADVAEHDLLEFVGELAGKGMVETREP